MSYEIAIDESGDTGSDSRFFSMASLITNRQRNLLPAVKVIPSGPNEFKFYKGEPDELRNILNTLAECEVRIVYVTVDKHDFSGMCYGLHGAELYQSVLKKLLEDTYSVLEGHDVNIFVDQSTYISIEQLKSMACSLAAKSNCIVQRCEKAVSHHNKIIQLADVTVGAVNRYCELGDHEFLKIIDKKVSVARKL